MSGKNGPSDPPKAKQARFPVVPGVFDLSADPPSMQEVPDLDACTALWDKYCMPAHIRDHSSQVALIVATLGAKAADLGARISRPVLLAGALLHDIAKAYTIEYGGSHAQFGAAWILRETKNYRVAQMVYHHVHWPWGVDIFNDVALGPLLLVYADKRVKHDQIVGIEERFEDLFRRYGHTETARLLIAESKEQGLQIERALSERLGVTVSEYSFDCRRLV